MTDTPGMAPRFPLLARTAPFLGGVLIAAVLAMLARRPLRAFDTYFHLRLGEEFRQGWSIAHPGQLSSASTNDWAPTQWLPQVGLSWIQDVSGTRGLTVLFAVLVSMLVASTYLLLRSRCGAGTAVALTAVALVGWLPSLSLRPQVLSYLFLVLVVAGWDRARRTGRPPWLLVPLAWVWAMSHGMWVLGVGASGVLAVALLAERRPDRRTAATLLGVPAAMLVAALLTPVGPRLLPAILLVNSRSDYFHEWRAPELATLGALPVTGLLAAAVLLLVRRDRPRPYEIALLGLGGVFAIYSTRTLPLAIIALACVVAAEAGRRHKAAAVGRLELGTLACLAAVTVLIAGTQSTLDDSGADVRAFSAELEALPDGSVVLTDWATGGVLLWTQPRLDVPLHGYGDVYTDAELERYDDLDRLVPGWEETLTDLAPSAAVLDEDEPLAGALLGLHWRVAAQSDDLVLLMPPSTAGRHSYR